jgi:uncharacterized protein DUF4333
VWKIVVLISGLAGSLAVMAVLGFVTPGYFVSRSFETASLQDGVAKVLRDDFQIAVAAVACPVKVPVRADLRFSCNALVDGRQVPISVRVLTDDGRFEVSRPR